MNVTLLRAFHLVAQTGGFTRAASSAGVSQPTLSAQVRMLEATHGVNLFDRRGRGVRLTPFGQSLYAITARLFAAEDEARALLSGARHLTGGKLRVAADSATHVMPLLAALRERHAGLTFSLRIGNSSDVLERIIGYDADVAVMAKRTSDGRIFSVPLRVDRLVLFVRRDHPWAERGSIPIGEIAGRELVIRERGSITREVFETRLAEAGVTPGPLVEVQTREAVREAVSAGFGLGIVFESELVEDLNIRSLAVEGTDLSVEEYAVCLEERRRIPLVRAFVDMARQAAAEAFGRDVCPEADSATLPGSAPDQTG